MCKERIPHKGHVRARLFDLFPPRRYNSRRRPFSVHQIRASNECSNRCKK
jgi:hypothetical protein